MQSKYYSWCLNAWVKGFATEAQLQVWVASGRITQEEYNTIIATLKNEGVI
jgi:hypothetical protein